MVAFTVFLHFLLTKLCIRLFGLELIALTLILMVKAAIFI